MITQNNGVAATDNWYSEISKHNYGVNQFVYETGHFTQVKQCSQSGINSASSNCLEASEGAQQEGSDFQAFLRNCESLHDLPIFASPEIRRTATH